MCVRSGGIDFRSQVRPRQAGGRAGALRRSDQHLRVPELILDNVVEVVMTAGRPSTQGLAGFPPRASVWMRISSTHAYVQGFPCLLQFGEGKKTHKDTEKLQLEVCSGPEAARVQTEQTALAPTPALPGDTGQVSHLVIGDSSSACLTGRMGDSRADRGQAGLGIAPGTVKAWALSLIV